MFKKIKNLRKDELIKGSIILFFMFGFYNLFNYLFQMSMARMLGPADYGVLAVLMSFIYIFTIPSEAIQTIVSRYTSRFSTKKSFGKMKDLLVRSLKKGVILALIAFSIFIPVALILSYFLKIEFLLIVITGISIFYAFIIPVVRGIIQGRKKFVSLGINLITESLIKLILSISLVLIGLKVYGAIAGVLIATLIIFILAFSSIKEITLSKRKNEEFKNVYSTNFPVLIAVTSIILMYSLDVILARRFFSPKLAGQYAFISLIGKVIIFSSAAIGKAMLPISSENFENGKKTHRFLKKSLVSTLLISVVALFFYFFFPETVIKIISLGSSQYTEASGILFIVGLAFSFTSLSNLLITYRISINKIGKIAYSLLLFIILQVVLLSIFNSSLMEFSISLLFVNLAMMTYLLIITKI